MSTQEPHGYPAIPNPHAHLAEGGFMFAHGLAPYGLVSRNPTRGVYFIWNGGAVVYIGMSSDITFRVNPLTHGCVRYGDSISWLPFSETEVKFAECFYIGICRPERNFKGMSGLKTRQADLVSTPPAEAWLAKHRTQS